MEKEFEEVMDMTFNDIKIEAFELLEQIEKDYESLTKKQLVTLIEKINHAHDIESVQLIIDLIKLFLKVKENKENE